MKAPSVVLVFIWASLGVYAQSNQDSPLAKPSDEVVRLLESKIRKAWDDYKNKNKEGLARILTDDAIEVEEGAEGAHDKKATLVEMDDINLTSVSLSDFHYRPIGSSGMLVRYTVDYAANVRGEAIHNKSIIGEVWEKTPADWKLVYFQETKTK
jgi:hypothetical protein